MTTNRRLPKTSKNHPYAYRESLSSPSSQEDVHLTRCNASSSNADNIGRGSKRRKAARAVSTMFSYLPLNFSGSPNGSDQNDTTKISLLEQENEILRKTIAQLERENEILEKTHSKQSIILEQFEGEGKPMMNANGEAVESTWWDKDHQYDDPESRSFNVGLKNRFSGSVGDERSRGSSISTSESLSAPLNSTSVTFAAQPTVAATSSIEECDEYADGACPIEPDISFKDALKDRAYWLVGLLTLQSMSGFILARNEDLLQTHPVIVYFLTMLVGAGGNAGNQAAVRVIRGIALGTLNERTQRQFLNREFKMALSLSAILSLAGFIRATAFNTPFAETVAVTFALAIIVFTSICFGAVLPLLLRRIDVDPAHSSTTIQVIMDILGVVLTVAVSTTILDSPLGQVIIGKLTGSS